MGQLLAFLFWPIILGIALWNAERRSTKIFLIFAILLNLAAFATAFIVGDWGKFQAFERHWNTGEPSYHID